MTKATRVTDGQLGTAHHLNDLIQDIREHTHAAGEGVVNHGDTTDGAIASGVTHTQMNTHVQGAGTSADPDNIGGNQGVHGLPAGAFVAGHHNKGLVITSGQAVTDGSVNREGFKVQTKAITFDGVTYSAAPAVHITPVIGESARIAVSGLVTTGCTVCLGFSSDTNGKSQQAITFNWMAVGVRA